MFEVDVKNVTHLCKKRVGVKEGRSEGGDQARFFMWKPQMIVGILGKF